MFCRNCGKELAGEVELCPECNANPLSGTKFCNHCGAETKPGAEFCVKCGAKLGRVNGEEISEEPQIEAVGEVSDKAEPKTDVEEVPEKPEAEVDVGTIPDKPEPEASVPQVSEKSRLTATLLTLLVVGIFGAHRFYLGKVGTAVAMLVLGVLGVVTIWFGFGAIFLIVVGIWAFVDFILAVAGKAKDKKGKPVRNW